MKKQWSLQVKYLRTPKWYDYEWRIMSEWCENNVGKGKWEYFSPYFMFDDEKHKLLFMLRWL